jgi:hypothetical protein
MVHSSLSILYTDGMRWIFFRAAIALLLTALLAIAGYILQNKNAADANKVQHEVVQEAAEREKTEAKAGRQLERVQTQNAELIMPAAMLSNQFIKAFDRAVLDCGLDAYMATYAMECISPPTQSHVSVHNLGNPATVKAWGHNPFLGSLPPEDVARLAADPVKRARWVESVTHGMLPPLRELVPLIQTKVCLPMGCARGSTIMMRVRRRAVSPQDLHEARSARQNTAGPRPHLGETPRWIGYEPLHPDADPRRAVGGDGRALG